MGRGGRGDGGVEALMQEVDVNRVSVFCALTSVCTVDVFVEGMLDRNSFIIVVHCVCVSMIG
jgi:hypothetical protein